MPYDKAQRTPAAAELRRYEVFNYVATLSPAHEGWFYTPDEWERSSLYIHCCASRDHALLMTDPLVGNGQMIGVTRFFRTSGTPAFTEQSLRELGTVCTL